MDWWRRGDDGCVQEGVGRGKEGEHGATMEKRGEGEAEMEQADKGSVEDKARLARANAGKG